MLPTKPYYPTTKNIHTWFNDAEHTFNEQFRSIVNNFFSHDAINGLKNKITNSSYPRLDVYAKDGKYHIDATVPGVDPDDLDIEVFEDNEDKYVKISGRAEERIDDANFITKELRRSQFTRIYGLPDNVVGDPEAVIKNGILSLTWQMPEKSPQKEVKKIVLKKE